MGKYFGTDGVRGVANTELTAELAFKLGRFGGYVVTKGATRPRVLVGRDTRVSGDMLEAALVAGLLSTGTEVMLLGVISTPGVAYLTRILDAQAGVMISASHNPVIDNGIKFFGADGFKLTDDIEQEIEQLLESNEDTLPRPVAEHIGQSSYFKAGVQKYIQYLKTTIDGDLSGLNIALDGANGSTHSIAPYLFGDLEANITTIGCHPDGFNINTDVGSTHPEKLAQHVLETNADMGFAFDGDGDRVIAVDEKGQIVDGDRIMYILAKYFAKEGRLNHNTVVSTVMSNLGFYKAIEVEELKSIATAVGDRYVVEAMREHDYNLGGEQSGHIVIMDYNTTGDGLLTAIQLAYIVKNSGKTLSELANEMPQFPQRLVNIRVTDKHAVEQQPAVSAIIAEVEQQMNGEGRVLVRPSGTEPLVRVMVEAATDDLADQYVNAIAEVVQREMGLN